MVVQEASGVKIMCTAKEQEMGEKEVKNVENVSNAMLQKRILKNESKIPETERLKTILTRLLLPPWRKNK